MAAQIYYPPVGFHFKVDIQIDETTDGDARFSEVSGLTTELSTEELQEGGENRFSHRLPGKTKYSNLVLKRGVLTGSKLVKWFTDAIDALEVSPADVKVTLLNENHEPLMGWSFVKAYPVKWQFSDLKATENSIVVETVELVYQFFRRDDYANSN
jgi:phage tail-like protein